MFSKSEKQRIAEKIEKLLLKLSHPEMPSEKPKFVLHVHGKEKWSWANIEPNWTFENKKPGVNPWNEISRKALKGRDQKIKKLVDDIWKSSTQE